MVESVLEKKITFSDAGASLLNWIEMSIAMSMAHRPNIVSLSFIRITLVDFHLNWLH